MAAGAVLGAVAGRIADGSYAKQKEYGRWHPMNPAGSAQRLAGVMAFASGVPQSDQALLQQPSGAPKGGVMFQVLCYTHASEAFALSFWDVM